MPNKNSYDNPFVITYSLGSFDFGAAGDITAIAVPAGVGRCKIEDISVMATEVFDGTAKVEIGSAGDANRYAELNILTLGDTNGLAMNPDTEAFDIGQGGKGIVDIATENITQLEVVLTAASSTGIAFTQIVIAWW